MTQPIHMPPEMQADLHQQGLIADTDYYYDDKGLLTHNTAKLKRYMEENNGEPWF